MQTNAKDDRLNQEQEPQLKIAWRGYDDFCKALDAVDEHAYVLLWLQDLFLRTCTCDPRTGDGHYNDLESYLKQLSKISKNFIGEDRLTRIVMHTGLSIKSLLRSPHEDIRREHNNIPIAMVREIDSVTIMWLNHQSGRTLREKLAGKLSIRAVSRRWYLDTLENRLFKEFLQRLQELFEEKTQAICAGDPVFEELAQHILRWLREDEVRDIGRWQNLPPNNMLLSDKNYRKIWDGWTWLMELDQQISDDGKQLAAFLLHMTFWMVAATLHEIEGTRFIQLPCLFNMRQCKAKPQWPHLQNRKQSLEVSFKLYTDELTTNKLTCNNIMLGKYCYTSVFKKIKRFLPLTIWNEGRSLLDHDAPDSLHNATLTFASDLEYLLSLNITQKGFIKFKQDCLINAARMHVDAPSVI